MCDYTHAYLIGFLESDTGLGVQALSDTHQASVKHEQGTQSDFEVLCFVEIHRDSKGTNQIYIHCLTTTFGCIAEAAIETHWYKTKQQRPLHLCGVWSVNQLSKIPCQEFGN